MLKTDDKKGEIINVPLPDTIIYVGDTMMITGSDEKPCATAGKNETTPDTVSDFITD